MAIYEGQILLKSYIVDNEHFTTTASWAGIIKRINTKFSPLFYTHTCWKKKLKKKCYMYPKTLYNRWVILKFRLHSREIEFKIQNEWNLLFSVLKKKTQTQNIKIIFFLSLWRYMIYPYMIPCIILSLTIVLQQDVSENGLISCKSV